MNKLQKCERLEKISISDLGNFKLELDSRTKSLQIFKDGDLFAWVFPSMYLNVNDITIEKRKDYNLASKIIERYEKTLGEEMKVLYSKEIS